MSSHYAEVKELQVHDNHVTVVMSSHSAEVKELQVHDNHEVEG